MYTNASALEVSAILTQLVDDGTDHPNAYASRKLERDERNYLTIKREGLGMVFALQKFHHYLLANTYTFYAYNQALKYLVKKDLHHGRICRWVLLFQAFEFEVVVRLGKSNVGPDHLYRIESGEDPTWIDNDLLDAHLFKVEAIVAKLA